MGRQKWAVILFVGLWLWPVVGVNAASKSVADDFAHTPIGSAGEPAWRPLDVGFMVQPVGGRRVMVADAPSGPGRILWQAVPFARAVTLEATVMPQAAPGGPWKTAGIGLYVNGDNFWHLAFVEGPEGQGRAHFAELAEMRGGVWNAQGEAATRQTVLEPAQPFPWTFGRTYRLRLTLAPGRLTGEVFEGTVSRFRCAYRLNSQAVTFGRPMLTASGMTAAFTDVRAAGIVPADPKAVAALTVPVTIPPYPGGPAPAKFFRVRRQERAWRLVDPRGRPMLAVGTDHVNSNADWCEALGYSPYHRQVAAKYGGEPAWAAAETKRLRLWHFNTLGAGCAPSTRYQGLAHTEFLSFGADFSGTAALVPKTTWTGWPDVFDPRWARFCDLRAAERCDPERRDPWLLGYFLDNELEWWGKHGRSWGLAEEAWRLPGGRAGKRALVASLRAFYRGDVSAFNTDFGTSLVSFDALEDSTEPATPRTDRGRTVLLGFVAEAARRYFEVTTAAVRRHDPNHLILGCRFAFDAPPDAWRWAGRTCDIVSVNVYPRVDLLRRRVVGLEDHLRSRFALCARPMMLTEWSFPALDARDWQGHPLPCKNGAGMRVDTQAQRALCYTLFQRALFRLPFMVGSDYFMWADEPALGVSHDFPEDSNYGLVSDTDTPYAALVAAAARVNAQAVALHAGRAVPPLPPALPIAAAPVSASGPPPVFMRTAAGYTLESDRLRLVKDQPRGQIFDHIFWREGAGGGWVELGQYGPLIQQAVNGQDAWVSPDRVTDVQSRTDGPRTVLDVTWEKGGGEPFRGAYEITLAPGQPYFLARCLWVENSGATPWHWHGYFHYTTSRLGGDASDDVEGGPGVPDYWLPLGVWHDPALNLDYGVLSPTADDRLDINFWKDDGGGEHPDCRRVLNLTLAPGERWSPPTPEPTLAVFGLHETPAQPRPWVPLFAELEAQAPATGRG